MARNSDNPWAKRVTIAGLILITAGALVISFNLEQLNDAASPKKISETSIIGDGTVTVDLIESCYSAVVIDDDFTDVNLQKMSGSNVEGEPLASDSCKTDWTPMDSDGSKFLIIKEWKVNSTGEYVLQTTCAVECENSTLWLVDATGAQWKMLEQPALVLGGSACCLGIIILPLAFILYQTNKGGNAPKVMMVGANGQMMPITDLTPETVARIQEQGVNNDTVDNPFADTGITNSEEFVDGREEVNNGTLLTTDQVFALMKGDVDEAKNRVSDPFADFNRVTKPEEPKKTTNSEEINTWDTGRLTEKLSPSSPKETKIHEKPKPVKNQESPKSKQWKQWDED